MERGNSSNRIGIIMLPLTEEEFNVYDRHARIIKLVISSLFIGVSQTMVADDEFDSDVLSSSISNICTVSSDLDVENNRYKEHFLKIEYQIKINSQTRYCEGLIMEHIEDIVRTAIKEMNLY